MQAMTEIMLPTIKQQMQVMIQEALNPASDDATSPAPPPEPTPAGIEAETPRPTLRAEEVGYFDPEYQAEDSHNTDKHAPLVNAGKHVYYRDVYAFVDRLESYSLGVDLLQEVSRFGSPSRSRYMAA